MLNMAKISWFQGKNGKVYERKNMMEIMKDTPQAQEFGPT